MSQESLSKTSAQGHMPESPGHHDKFKRYFLLGVLIISSILFFNLIKIFFVPILLATVFTTLFYPLYDRMLKRLRHRRNLSAFICCLTLLLGLLVPLYLIGDMVASEAVHLYETVIPEIQQLLEKGDAGLLGEIKKNPIVQRLKPETIDWYSYTQEIAKRFGDFLAQTSRSTLQVVVNLFTMLFTMFYFFRDGEGLIQRIKYLSPLEDIYEEAIIFRFVSVARATIKGTLLIGLIQGGLGGIVLWLFGVESPVLWGVVMVVLSIIPLVGSWLVLYPAAIFKMLTGEFWQGVAMALITAIVITNIDNLLRPRLVGRDAGMHDLMIFFSTLGGISVFGVMGFIVGPVLAVFFLTILDIYSVEFKTTLDLGQHPRYTQPKPNPPEELPVKQT
jgi:predicted PurR-regulated permease PerM